MARAYLTIDDSPSPVTLDISAFLNHHNISAFFYCRGDNLEKFPAVALELVRQGHVIANHGYAHKRAVHLSFEDIVDDIERCEVLIEKAYQEAGVTRPGKFYRFPYLDRGCGAWIVNFDQMPEKERAIIHGLFADGLFLDDVRPTDELLEKKQRLQFWLADKGFEVPFHDVGFDWYSHPQMRDAKDALYTFSTADWMLTKRHLEKDHPYKTVEDLKRKIDDDPYLFDSDHNNIVLIHDQEELLDVFKALVSHMAARGIEFLSLDEKAVNPSQKEP